MSIAEIGRKFVYAGNPDEERQSLQEAFYKGDIDPGNMTALAWDKSLGDRLWFSIPYRVPDFPDIK
jgi:hypothetical protein